MAEYEYVTLTDDTRRAVLRAHLAQDEGVLFQTILQAEKAERRAAELVDQDQKDAAEQEAKALRAAAEGTIVNLDVVKARLAALETVAEPE